MSSSFAACLGMLQAHLERRNTIVANIETLLNCQKAPGEYHHDYARLAQQFAACLPTRELAALTPQLEQAHWADGFTPRSNPGNDLVHPVEQMVRAFNLWRLTRWPGSKGRLRFAHTLFNLHVLRNLTLLCMRIWDDDAAGASTRLAQLQALLDALWTGTPADQPRLVRNVGWLYPVAMSPTTDSLRPYFPAAERIAGLPVDACVEIFRAWVVTGAAHLRSQHFQLARQRGVALEDHSLVLITRVSNALDLALLVQGLVILLQAYERSLQSGDAQRRAELAFAIYQGISPDPELFVNRNDLLLPYSMIEELFISADGSSYTAMGRRHLALFAEYQTLIARLAPALYADRGPNKPVQGAWSPYGVLFGFASNLLELTAFKTLQVEADTRFCMEDIFTNGDASKLAWVNNWRNLPHIKPEVVKQFEFPYQFAQESHAGIERALEKFCGGTAQSPQGRLHVATDSTRGDFAHVPKLPSQYVVSSDAALVAAQQAEARDEGDLLHCRMEGEFLVSYKTAGGWLALTKDLLTDVLGRGHDARIEMPPAPAEVLQLMCPAMVVLPRH